MVNCFDLGTASTTTLATSSSTTTSSSTSSVTTTTTTKYVYQNSFVLNAFPFNSTNNGRIQVGLTDFLTFLPCLYSFDLNKIVDPLSLAYNYYCILSKTDPGDFSQGLYALEKNTALTQDQIKSANTCFKTSGMYIQLCILF